MKSVTDDRGEETCGRSLHFIAENTLLTDLVPDSEEQLSGRGRQILLQLTRANAAFVLSQQ